MTEGITSSPFDGFDWNRLIGQIGKGRAIPILGPALVQTERGPLHDVLLASLHEEDGGASPTQSLRGYVQGLMGKIGPVRQALCDAHDALPPEPPQELLDLAKIGFPLYVSLTSDTYLQTALARAHKTPDLYTFHGNHSSSEDLPLGKLKGARTPAVFRLFSTPEIRYPWTEEEVLEYIYDLQDINRPKNLLAALRSSYLLFLGCEFPDWLMRVFVRLITGTRLSKYDHDVAVVDSEHTLEAPLSQFLRTTKAMVISGASTRQFITELHRRWAQEAPKWPSEENPKIGHVFLSFIGVDRAKVVIVLNELKRRDILVWYDKDRDRLLHGGRWREELEHAIDNAAVFMPFVSNNTCDHFTKEVYIYEWNHALNNTAKGFLDSYRFIRPITIGDVDIQRSQNIDNRLRRLQVIRHESIDYDLLADELRRALVEYAGRPGR